MRQSSVIRIISSILICASLCASLISCGYTDKPISEYEYPSIMYVQSTVPSSSSVLSAGEITDGDSIKDFVDMINGCSFKKAELSEVDEHQYAAIIIDEDAIEDGALFANFYIRRDGEYLILPEDMNAFLQGGQTVTAYKVRGCKDDILNLILPKL